MEPERDVRDTYYSKVHAAAAATTNALGMSHNLNGKRPMTASGQPSFAGQMAPPPAKVRMQMQMQNGHHHHYQDQQYGQQFRDVSDENLSHVNINGLRTRVEGSESAWSTELEETY